MENQPWQDVIRYDFSAIQKIDPHGILPKLIEARFCLEEQQLTPTLSNTPLRRNPTSNLTPWRSRLGMGEETIPLY
ncbi:hypothetical protein [uncultured Nostoc sp.]|uniref:hypothetical protein n=1 Tax=uncultured Nostoc sp. TaxID=340711 RepID=UPI0035C9A3AF